MLKQTKKLAVVAGIVGLCAVIACTSVSGGALPGGGGFVQFTIAGKTYSFTWGDTGVFNVQAKAAPVVNGLRVQNLFPQTPTDRPATGQVKLNPTSVNVTPLDIGKSITQLQRITGSFDMVVYIGDVGMENPCETGTRVGTFHITVSGTSVSIDTTTLDLPTAALEDVIAGSFTICVELSGDVDATIIIEDMSIIFGEAATTTATFTFQNDDIENIHFLLPGQDFPDNRVGPGWTATDSLLGVQIGDSITVRCGRNGVVLDSTNCPTVTGTDYTATVVWDGFGVTCEAQQSDDSGGIIQVPIDRNGDAAEATTIISGVDYAEVGVMSDNSPAVGPAPYPETVTVDLGELGLASVQTIYLATHSAHSWDIPNGVKVATFTCEYAEGGTPTTLDMVMGQNTAEWAFENPCQLEFMGGPVSHSQPTILFNNPTSIDCDREYVGHTFAASMQLDSTRTLQQMTLELEDAQDVAYTRTPPNADFLLLTQAHMAITLEGPAGTPAVGPSQDECTYDSDCDPGEECVDGECVPEEEGGAFEITGVDYPSSVTSGGDSGDLSVSWSGDPVFPVEIVYQLAGDCPSGFTCETPTMTFNDETSPLVFTDAVYCYGATEDVVFDYEVVMIDNRGVESDPYSASFTCELEAGSFTNGSFETGPAVSNYLPLNPDDTSITGWTVTRGQIDLIGSEWTSADGDRSIDLDGSPGSGGIAQTFQTTSGAAYTVTFAMAGNPIGGDAVKHMRVEADGTTQDYSFDTTGRSSSDMGWVTETFQFTATDTQTTLEFYSLSASGSSFGPAIDNVVVNAD